jgi:hypothetical protein
MSLRPIRASRVPPLGQRTLALLVALALQISFLLLLAQPVLKPSLAVRQLARDLTLTLPRLPVPRLRTPSRLARPAPQIPAIRPEVPPTQAPSTSSVIPFIPPDAIQGFGQALNDCASENYASLPDDKKTLCNRPGAGVAVQQAPNLMGAPPPVRNNDIWAAQLAARNTPLRVDCTHLATQSLGPGHNSTSVFVDPLCAARELQRHLEH